MADSPGYEILPKGCHSLRRSMEGDRERENKEVFVKSHTESAGMAGNLLTNSLLLSMQNTIASTA